MKTKVKIIGVRVTEQQLRDLKRQAKKNGLALSTFVRTQLLSRGKAA